MADKYKYPVIISGLYEGDPTKTALIEISSYRSLLSLGLIQYDIKKQFEESKVLKATIADTVYTSKYFHISIPDANLVQRGTKSIKEVACTPLDVMDGIAIGLALEGRCLVLIAHEVPAEDEDGEGGSSSSSKGSSKKRAKKQ